jgi:hypothetical protein
MEAAGDRWWAVSGGVYFVHAVKRVPGMRLIKPRWNENLVKKLLPVAPKLNNTQCNCDSAPGLSGEEITRHDKNSK